MQIESSHSPSFKYEDLAHRGTHSSLENYVWTNFSAIEQARKIKGQKSDKKYRDSHKKEIAVRKKEYRERIKLEGIQVYGGKCSCCGEAEPRFLTLEHLNGREKGDVLTGKKAWAKVKALGYPSDYTVLCFNCNCCKGAYGKCAHEKT